MSDGLRKTEWDVQRSPVSLVDGVGSDVDNPRGLVARPELAFSQELMEIAPGPGVPAHSNGASRSALAGAFSVIELVVRQGEIEPIWFQVVTTATAGGNPGFFLVFSNANIATTPGAIAAGSALYTARAAALFSGTRVSGLGANAQFSDGVFGKGFLPRIHKDWRVGFVTAVQDCAIQVAMVYREWTGANEPLIGA